MSTYKEIVHGFHLSMLGHYLRFIKLFNFSQVNYMLAHYERPNINIAQKRATKILKSK
jgi:hypothetical protein